MKLPMAPQWFFMIHYLKQFLKGITILAIGVLGSGVLASCASAAAPRVRKGTWQHISRQNSLLQQDFVNPLNWLSVGLMGEPQPFDSLLPQDATLVPVNENTVAFTTKGGQYRGDGSPGFVYQNPLPLHGLQMEIQVPSVAGFYARGRGEDVWIGVHFLSRPDRYFDVGDPEWNPGLILLFRPAEDGFTVLPHVFQPGFALLSATEILMETFLEPMNIFVFETEVNHWSVRVNNELVLANHYIPETTFPEGHAYLAIGSHNPEFLDSQKTTIQVGSLKSIP